MSVISSGKKIDLGPWIKHFEEQARGGSSVRAYINRHYIIVPGGGRGFEDKNICDLNSGDISTPAVVAPVEQGIEQAEAEVKREKVGEEKHKLVKEFGNTVIYSNKKCRKQRLVPKDIFS